MLNSRAMLDLLRNAIISHLRLQSLSGSATPEKRPLRLGAPGHTSSVAKLPRMCSRLLVITSPCLSPSNANRSRSLEPSRTSSGQPTLAAGDAAARLRPGSSIGPSP